MPVTMFTYCYGRIFYVVRHQRKVRAGRIQDVPISIISRDHTTGQIQQQATQADAKLSRREMNVLQTMILVIVCFIVCWTPAAYIVFADLLTVGRSTFTLTNSDKVTFIIAFFNYVQLVFLI